MCTTYAMDTCIETNENIAFGMEVYSRYIYLGYAGFWYMEGIYLVYTIHTILYGFQMMSYIQVTYQVTYRLHTD